jgi:hypothetical protein
MGKTLTLKTIKALYEGKLDLFKDTWIYNQDLRCLKDTEGRNHPVILITPPNLGDEKKFPEALITTIADLSPEFPINFKVPAASNLGSYIKYVCRKSNDSKAVILVDEYDKPVLGLLNRLGEEKAVELVTREMHNFYETLKTCEDNIHKCIIVGSAKFAKVSLFSGNSILIRISIE